MATVSFQTNPLTVIQEIMERRVQLIDEIARLGLVGLSNNSLLDILTLGGFDDCCAGSITDRQRLEVGGWPAPDLRDSTWALLRDRERTDPHRTEMERNDASQRGADMAFGWIPVNDAWACVDEARIPEPSRP
ncbi:hypothetical protein ELG72_24985 [Rhizobium leguminosarum]|uniref:hypothetical protein n=1 Tax=Rhizobium leguminosarum TaxID=384 RepID=UPI00102F8703|nr:hypothetical protein [Rhizobium leguminosarum]TBG66116.1 hypothetical protein ELG72_24985 [Rhizobium leguminosarum]TBG70874.1 hypothetical protein ELG74_24735 [Rhizobium leguminosarum]